MSGIAESLFAEREDPRTYNRHITVGDLIKFEDNLPSPSGGGITANHGNTAYVSSVGDDGTGEVGNISKPFATATAAKDALDPASQGNIVILSASSVNVIDGYDFSATNPYSLSITDLTNQGVKFTGTCSFGDLYVEAKTTIEVATTTFFVCDNAGKLIADSVFFSADCDGTAGQGINIDCNNLTFNIPSTSCSFSGFANLNWRLSLITYGQAITYTRCNPMVVSMNLTQNGTTAPDVAMLENTSGATVTASYTTIGSYELNFSPAIFPDADKVMIHQGSFIVGSTPGQGVNISIAATDKIGIESFDDFPTAADGILQRYSLKLEIYP